MSDRRLTPEHFRALFDPEGVLVTGASTHPGKFGFVALHNILVNGYGGTVQATNRDRAEVLGVATCASVDEVDDGSVDLVFVCTPPAANGEVLRAAADKGAKAAFIASGGYGEAGPDGQRAQEELVALAEELDLLLVGPNGQGVVSTPASLCAQIVAPYPAAGRIGIVSQSGNIVSSLMNYSCATGVGVSRALSAGNAAAIDVSDVLRYFADDPETDVAVAYVEGAGDGRRMFERLSEITERMPVVLVKGGASEGGRRAAASHTGSLASDDRVFDGMCRQAGALRAVSVEQAFDVAAALATQPLPKGPRVAVMTTAGGWGVLTADAIADSNLELLALPADLLDDLNGRLPPRWSRNNPIDLAGGETKDTIPEVMEALAMHPAVDAVVVLGMGIQSNQGRMEERGRFYPDWGLERIASFHERQDRRYTTVACELAARSGKPVLVASELAVTDPGNAAVAGVREAGGYCFPSSPRAIAALDRMWSLARWRIRRT